MEFTVCEIFWQRFFISEVVGAFLTSTPSALGCCIFSLSFEYNLAPIGVLEFVVVIDVYAQPTREMIKFYRTASKEAHDPSCVAPGTTAEIAASAAIWQNLFHRRFGELGGCYATKP